MCPHGHREITVFDLHYHIRSSRLYWQPVLVGHKNVGHQWKRQFPTNPVLSDHLLLFKVQYLPFLIWDPFEHISSCIYMNQLTEKNFRQVRTTCLLYRLYTTLHKPHKVPVTVLLSDISTLPTKPDVFFFIDAPALVKALVCENLSTAFSNCLVLLLIV